jgi:hypothetical protein
MWRGTSPAKEPDGSSDMTSDETEEVEVGEADEAEGAEMADVAEVAVDEDELELAELDDDFDWVAGFDEAEDDDEVDEADEAVDEVEGFDEEEDEDEEDIEDLEVVEVEDVVVEVAKEPEQAEDDALMEDDESGWLKDPDVEGQERFWDGTEWTDQVRSVEEETDFRGRLHLPDHVPELQRALAAATADIDDVEARLSTLFDRGEGKRGRAVSPSAAGPPIHEEFGGPGAGVAGVGDASSPDGTAPIHTGGEGTGGLSGDDDDAFAELDAALAAEAPEKPERRFFKRRS